MCVSVFSNFGIYCESSSIFFLFDGSGNTTLYRLYCFKKSFEIAELSVINDHKTCVNQQRVVSFKDNQRLTADTSRDIGQRNSVFLIYLFGDDAG